MLGRLAAIASVAGFILAAPAAAEAACGPRDIAGAWLVVVGGESCDIRVRPTGLFPASPCYDAGGRRVSTLTGRLRVDRACRVNGSAILKVGRRSARLVVSGRMNRAHDLISGRVRNGSLRLPFTAYAQ